MLNQNELSKEFYAAFVQDSYHVPGDERSRTHPGHGYPAHTVDYVKVEEFENEEEMKRWVEKEEKSIYAKRKYRIIKCIPMKVTTTVRVETAVR